MIESEAVAVVELVRELWPSKFSWTPESVDLWAEKFTRSEWTLEQCRAVVRDERTRDDGKSAPMARIYKRCHEAHRSGRKIENPTEATPITDAEWARIYADREAAAAWWFENKPDRATIVEQATLAYPMWATSFRRFLDPDFRPMPFACLRLKCAWQEFHDTGPRASPVHAPGIMASMSPP